MNKLFGYARVSTESQNLAMQFDMLETHGVKREDVFYEKESGKNTDRKEFEKLINILREGDKILFFDLFRVGRDLKHLIIIAETLIQKGVHFKDLTLPFIDSESLRTTNGEFIFLLFGAFGQFQRRNIVDKVNLGIAASKKAGTYSGGRPPGLSARIKELAPLVGKLYTQTNMTNKEICATYKIAPNTMYNCLEDQKIPLKVNENRRRKNAA